jgi:hypothetical protein
MEEIFIMDDLTGEWEYFRKMSGIILMKTI